jgi:ABC-type bacteriocin/lantibiotic exporter with double-glycine peptidase domain
VIGRSIVVFLLLVGGSACSPFQQARPADTPAPLQRIADVPYHPQEARGDCGPAALASLLNHRGGKISVAEITKEVYSARLDGTLLADLENFAKRQGFATRSGRGDLPLLRRSVDAGRPVIVLVDNGLWVVSRPHYLVVFGYDDQRFLVHAGTAGEEFIDAPDLLSRWEKMRRLYLYLE